MSNKAKIREEAKKLNPIDDLMFRKMAEDKRFCEEILRTILSDQELTVLECTPQYTGTNLQGRSVILDARCILGNGKLVDVEIQKADDDHHQKRMRYNGSVLTANIMDPGQKFENVPDVYAVFISNFDIFNGSHAVYHVDRIVRETGERADNGFEEVYVNAVVKDGSDVSELMEVFTNDSAYNNRYPVTSGIKRRLKETEEGQNIMCEIMEKLVAEERRQAMAEGRKQEKIRINMLYAKLIKEGRIADLERSVSDNEYEKKLMLELFPEYIPQD